MKSLSIYILILALFSCSLNKKTQQLEFANFSFKKEIDNYILFLNQNQKDSLKYIYIRSNIVNKTIEFTSSNICSNIYQSKGYLAYKDKYLIFDEDFDETLLKELLKSQLTATNKLSCRINEFPNFSYLITYNYINKNFKLNNVCFKDGLIKYLNTIKYEMDIINRNLNLEKEINNYIDYIEKINKNYKFIVIGFNEKTKTISIYSSNVFNGKNANGFIKFRNKFIIVDSFKEDMLKSMLLHNLNSIDSIPCKDCDLSKISIFYQPDEIVNFKYINKTISLNGACISNLSEYFLCRKK